MHRHCSELIQFPIFYLNFFGNALNIVARGIFESMNSPLPLSSEAFLLLLL